jgi:hypothetical protein
MTAADGDDPDGAGTGDTAGEDSHAAGGDSGGEEIAVVTVDEDGETSHVAGPAETEGEGITGGFSPAEEIEPGQIDLENAAFVLLGAMLTLLVFVRMFALL